MIIINEVQTGLSSLQAIPIVGPLVFSPAKIVLGTAQVVAGLATGIFFGMLATSAAILELRKISEGFGEGAKIGFTESILGFGSLFYASLNMATLGILGLVVVGMTHEMRDRRFGY